MKPLRCIHLNNDFAMGGVVKALGIYSHPDLAQIVDSDVMPVDPSGLLAPKIDADVIFTHFPPSWSRLPFLMSLRLRNPRARMVHVEHSYTAGWEAGNVPSRGRFRKMLKLAYRLFDEVVAVSKGQAAWLREIGAVDPVRLKVIHPWSGTQELDRLPPPDFAEGKPVCIGALGRFDHVKGFDTLIEAMRKLPSDRFKLILGGFGEEEDRLRELARGMDNVHFAGRIDDAAKFYGQTDIVALPSRWEAFGQVAAEARLAGRPIIVSDVDGLPEQVGDAGLVLEQRDAQAIASAITSLPRLRLQQMSRNARLSMAGAEVSRINAWLSLFVRARKALDLRGGAGAQLSTPSKEAPRAAA